MENRLKITQKPLKGDDGYRTFSVRIKKEILLEIEKIVNATGRTRNELIGILLDFAIKNCDIEQ